MIQFNKDNRSGKKMAIIAGYFESENYGLLGPQMAATIIQDHTPYECIVFAVTREYDRAALKKALAEDLDAVFGSRTLGGQAVYVYPQNYIGVLGLNAAINLLYCPSNKLTHFIFEFIKNNIALGIPDFLKQHLKKEVVSSANFRATRQSKAPFDAPDGSPILFDTDMNGISRAVDQVQAGPLQVNGQSKVYSIWKAQE